jgi:O-antigen ligase
LVWLIALVFLAGGVLGGGDTSIRLSMFVELPACFLGALAIAGLVDGDCPHEAKTALVLLALICLVPVFQLVPLPASSWKSLPGREVPYTISRVAGLANLARPISLDPEQTRIAALSLIVPAAVFIAALQLDLRGRDQIMLVVVVFAFASALLGIFQVASGGSLDLGIYRQVHDGFPIGFFANRNHEASLLLIAMPMSAHLVRLQHWASRTRAMTIGAIVFFFSLSVIATASRSGFALLVLAWAGTTVVWIGNVRDRRIWLSTAGLLVILVVAFGLLDLTGAGHRVIHRFNDVGEDLRPFIWHGSWAAIESFWPLGSGAGSFVPIYKMFEDLNSVNDAWVNHAHDDYLELLLDTGIAGVVLLAVYITVFMKSLFRSLPSSQRSQRYVAVFTLLILLAHSLTDYPLRTFGLLSIFAFANALLFPGRDMLRARRSGSHPTQSPPSAFASDFNHA